MRASTPCIPTTSLPSWCGSAASSRPASPAGCSSSPAACSASPTAGSAGRRSTRRRAGTPPNWGRSSASWSTPRPLPNRCTGPDVDFDDTPEEAAFRAEARTWLAAHARPVDPAVGHRRNPWGDDEAEHVAGCKAWQRTLYDGGWAGITWPKEYGGRGATATQAAIFAQEQSKFDVSNGVFAVGIGMVGPTLIAHGTDEQKE